jgi:hypothetical protein
MLFCPFISPLNLRLSNMCVICLKCPIGKWIPSFYFLDFFLFISKLVEEKEVKNSSLITFGKWKKCVYSYGRVYYSYLRSCIMNSSSKQEKIFHCLFVILILKIRLLVGEIKLEFLDLKGIFQHKTWWKIWKCWLRMI